MAFSVNHCFFYSKTKKKIIFYDEAKCLLDPKGVEGFFVEMKRTRTLSVDLTLTAFSRKKLHRQSTVSS